MKTVAVIGSGPTGLFVAKYLSDTFKINLYEKDKRILGHYNYSLDKKDRNFTKILENDNIKLHLNKEIRSIEDLNEEIVVLCTGGISNDLYKDTKSAYKQIQKFFDSGKKTTDVKENICIIGMGNVTMDFLKIFNNKIKDASVLSRNNIYQSKFDNDKIRELEKLYNINILPTTFDTTTIETRKDKTRKAIFDNLPEHKKTKPTLNLLFNTETVEAGKKKIIFKQNDVLYKKAFDEVYISIGFISNNSVSGTSSNKNIYKLGWCNEPTGDISMQQINARSLAERIKLDVIRTKKKVANVFSIN